MAKTKTRYVCSECGFAAPAWTGQCPSCGAWNTLVEEIEEAARPLVRGGKGAAGASQGSRSSRIYDLSTIPTQTGKRYDTGIGEFDRVLGGGIVPGSVVLAGGEPGIGKSTLFLQAAGNLLRHGSVLYVSGEESATQIRMRADRLGIQSGVKVMTETQMDVIAEGVRDMKPDFLIVDSIQTLYDPSFTSAPGSVTQVRGCASAITRLSKQAGMPSFIIGHVTKAGALAGPRVLEHIVDTVLYFEGDRASDLRVLRAVKNRFGGTDELGLFEMRDDGMHEVLDPGVLLDRTEGPPLDGVAIYPATQGARPMLLEVQALCSTTQLNIPRRLSSGVDMNRLYMLCAVLEKKIGLKMYANDVFVNVAGGIRIREHASDLAIAMAIVSSLRGRPLAKDTAFVGEIGLSGELRPVNQMQKRLSECARMGIKNVIMPAARSSQKAPKGLRLTECATLFQAFEHAL